MRLQRDRPRERSRRATTTRETERELLRAYHEDGDLAARARLIEEFVPLVRWVVARYRGRGEPIEDLVQVGCVGLIKAIDRFDLERGVTLTTYAVPSIDGEIRRHFRDKCRRVRVPRRLVELNLRLFTLTDELAHTLGRSPTIGELAHAAGATEEDVIEALEVDEATASISLSRPAGDDERDLRLLDVIGDVDDRFELVESRTTVIPALRVLDRRERRIVYLRFFEGRTQSEIACELGLSQMHVSRLIRAALEKIRAAVVAGESARAPDTSGAGLRSDSRPAQLASNGRGRGAREARASGRSPRTQAA